MDEIYRWASGVNGYYLFLVVFAAVAVWEGIQPLRKAEASTAVRWTNNLLWLALNYLIIRLALPFLAVSWAAHASEMQWGLFNLAVWPVWLKFLLGLCLLDLGSYLLHIAFHRYRWLWRIHAIHHSDIDFDCTTGFRFHPLEAILSILWRLAIISIFGISPACVAAYELWVVLQNLYGHANASFPQPVERILNWLVVTPDMHRVHHSSRPDEYDSNFGIIFPWWDRLLHHYKQLPASYQATMPIGLDWLRKESLLSVPTSLWLPFSSSFRGIDRIQRGNSIHQKHS